MATQIKISELPLASEDALSLASDDRFIFNNDNVNTQTIKFANLVDAIVEQNLTFTGNCSFSQPITGPNGADLQVGLDDLVDVQFQNVTSGQIITYSGTQWINRDVKAIALQLDSLSVNTVAASGGGALTYDNTTGVFTFAPAVSETFTASSISVTVSNAAANGGNLTYNQATGAFTFTPADNYTKAESYNKTEVDAALADKANLATTYTKTEVDTAVATKASNILLGVANGSDNLGDFAGSTIATNTTVKLALQSLETAVEAAASSTGINYDDLSVVTGAASGTGSLTYNDLGVFTFVPADFSTYQTSGEVAAAIALETGTNLDLQYKDTGDLSEGVNLYYTDARADARVAAASINYTTAATGTANDNAIDNLIAGLVAIGNDAAVTDVSELKAALAALVRDNT